MIEVEIRSFISKEQFAQLITVFQEQGQFINTDEQETFYFQAKQDLRIQRNSYFTKIVLKQGKIHDEAREELEIKVDRDQFESLEKLFIGLGYPIKIKWFRTRHTFDWQGIKVMLDYTKGYGYIIELEKMTSEAEKDLALLHLKQKMADLSIALTPRAVFDEKFKNYEQNWQQLVAEEGN